MLFFFYVYRSLVARLRANAITILSVALFVAGATLGLAFYGGLRSMLHTAPSTHVLVLADGAVGEVSSMLDRDTGQKLALLDGIAKANNELLLTREVVVLIYLDSSAFKDYKAPVPFRGIDASSFAVHGAKLIEGTAPAPNSLDVLVGQRLHRSMPALKVGSEIALPGGTGRISGFYSAGGSVLEDEVWTERAALELHAKAKKLSSITIVAESADKATEIVSRINASKEYRASAMLLTKFWEDRYGLGSLARTVFILLVLLSIVAVSAIATTMHAAISSRLSEFATMAAIGIPRGHLRRIVIMESALLSILGALIGLGVSELVRWRIGTVTFAESPIVLATSVKVLLLGIPLGLLVGLLGGLPSGIKVGRIDIISSLR